MKGKVDTSVVAVSAEGKKQQTHENRSYTPAVNMDLSIRMVNIFSRENTHHNFRTNPTNFYCVYAIKVIKQKNIFIHHIIMHFCFDFFLRLTSTIVNDSGSFFLSLHAHMHAKVYESVLLLLLLFACGLSLFESELKKP